MQDLPNGFTGFANRPKNSVANYRSASEAARSSEHQSNLFTGSAIKGSPNYQYSRSHAAHPESPVEGPTADQLAAIDDRDRRWAWVEVDRSAIQYNVMQTKRLLSNGCRLMAVVKADAYGHGAVEVAKAACSAGASYLGVATVNEAIELREAGMREPILILAEPPAEAIPLLLHYNIRPSVYTSEFAIAYGEAADALGMKAPFHLAINSGMNRIGVRFNNVVEFLSQISFHRALELEGCFTHFATADAPETLDLQIHINHFF